MVFEPPICREKGYPRFWTCVFKSHLLPAMWPIFVEFRSASSDRKKNEERKKERKKEESVSIHKSADNYVGRPNYVDLTIWQYTICRYPRPTPRGSQSPGRCSRLQQRKYVFKPKNTPKCFFHIFHKTQSIATLLCFPPHLNNACALPSET